MADAQERGAEDYWCLGDIVGYGPDPNECVTVVTERASLCLSGNHDLAAIGELGLDYFNADGADATRWTSRVLAGEQKEILAGLTTKLASGDVTLAHGSPREPVWEYVVSPPVAAINFEHFETRMCFVGHSHLPFFCREPEAHLMPRLQRLAEDETLEIGEGRLIINPGSVGQPRDGDPRASYVIYDTAREILHQHRVAYDIRETQDKMRSVGLPHFLIDRLECGH